MTYIVAPFSIHMEIKKEESPIVLSNVEMRTFFFLLFSMNLHADENKHFRNC